MATAQGRKTIRNRRKKGRKKLANPVNELIIRVISFVYSNNK